MTVKQLAAEFDLWSQVETAVRGMQTGRPAADFLDRIARIPILPSRATRSLGCYMSRSGRAVCIRLQFAQEPDTLKQTFLHELAHACDHLSREPGRESYRLTHGSAWKRWALALGITTRRCGESEAVRKLHQKRMKLVAVCSKCGAEFHRVRSLNKNRLYSHNRCGGKIEPV